MLQLRCRIADAERTFRLDGQSIRVGRDTDNQLRLPDPSVSRHHALLERSDDGWRVRDLGSTNGTKVNGAAVDQARLETGDLLHIGAFELTVVAADAAHALGAAGAAHASDASDASDGAPAPPRSGAPSSGRREPSMAPPAVSDDLPEVVRRVPNATIVRSLDTFSAEYGLGGTALPAAADDAGEAAAGGSGVAASDGAYGARVFGLLTRLARLLLTAETVPQVVERAMDVAFEALPVERGFLLLADADGEVTCELARFGDRVELRPRRGVPVSNTILEAVMGERVALLTYDALSDQRLSAGESIRLHGIRAALSVPVWSGDEIIGVLQVDSPVQAGALRERDLDFLTALANFTAVAIERVRAAQRVEVERKLRARLERYHSPAVIESLLRESDEAGESGLHTGLSAELRAAEASVLFADLVGFTSFAETNSPEVVAELLAIYFDEAVEAVFAAGGTLDKFIGDAVMAFFGAPLPQEDHALRAVTAARSIRRSVAARTAEHHGLPRLDVRIGVNSGPVVVGDVGSYRRVDYTVLGNTVNIAARLEQWVAGPGEIVIGPETHRQVAGRIATEPLGEMALKGLQQRIEAFRVID